MAPAKTWRPVITKAEGPLYLAIADAIAADMASGALPPCTRLPPQRALAEALGIDFTTVSRGYAEARRRGLVEGKVGQGTFVRARRSEPTAGAFDLSMNQPPPFDDPALVARMWAGIAAIEAEGGLELLLRYQEAGGTIADRAAGAGWLAPRVPGLPVERVLVTPGARGALLAVASLLAGPGDAICAEALTYPGMRSLAEHLRIRLVPLAMDGEGIDPDAFAAACRAERPKALYCCPTLHNPTTATLSAGRRAAIVAIARQHGVPIIEDDAYGALVAAPPVSLAALAPELTYHMAGLAKCVSPALRIGYLALPETRLTARAAAAIRATAVMASPLSAAIATRWIGDGTAEKVTAAIRAETRARRALARAIFPEGMAVSDPEGFHAWLRLPAPWTRGDFAGRLSSAGIGAVLSDAFALCTPPEAVRLGLGAAPNREELTRRVHVIADLLEQSPALATLAV